MLFRVLIGSALFLLPLGAIDLVVNVSGVTSDKGEIGCALFRGASGFPMDSAKATSVRIQAKAGTVECKFANLSPGKYAVSVSHDLNANRKTDTNFVGMPKEDWGVSNNVRPRLRAPRFEEAGFEIKEGEVMRLEVRIGR